MSFTVKKFLDRTGLIHVWELIGQKFADKATYFEGTKAKGALDSDKLEGKSKAEVVAEAQTGLAKSEDLTNLTGRVGAVEGYFNENGKANGALIADAVSEPARATIISEAQTGLAKSEDLTNVQTALGAKGVASADSAFGKILTLEGKFTGTKANHALTTDAVAEPERTNIINKAHEGYDTAEVANGKYAAKSIETDVNNLKSTVEGLSSVTRFIGVYASLPDGAGTDSTPKTGKKGDVVIVGDKEYLYNAADGKYDQNSWVELGDTTKENLAITALQGKFNESGRANDAQLLEGKTRQSIIDEARTGLDSSEAITALQDKVTVLEGNFTDTKAKHALIADAVAEPERAHIITAAREGYETAEVAATKYADIAVEGYFENGVAKTAKISNGVETVARQAIITDAQKGMATETNVTEAYNAIDSLTNDDIDIAFGLKQPPTP